MKKINYDKYSHEINLEETDKNNSWVSKTRKKLNKNKIFINLISSVFLTIMSITISIIGVIASVRSAEIYEEQLKIMENDREPYFTITSESVDGIFNGSDYNYVKKIYTIENEGGLIMGACIPEIYTYIFMQVYNTDTGEKNTYILYLDDIFEKEEVFSIYNSKNKEFKFYKHESDKVDKLVPKLKSYFEKTFSNKTANKYTLETYISNYIEMEYINYENVEFEQKYKLIDEDQVSLVKMNEDIDDAYIIGTISIEEDFSKFVESICVFFKNTINFGSNEEALEIAKRYLSTYPYSREGLIEQLNYRDIFSYDNAVYAADNCGADWNEQAVKTAENYLSFEPYSYNKLLEVLTSVEKFTHDQAIYGINNCEVDWNHQAERRIQGYIYSNKACSYNELIKLLEDEGFTHEQAVYGVKQNGYYN